jgi:hypothetical protein
MSMPNSPIGGKLSPTNTAQEKFRMMRQRRAVDKTTCDKRLIAAVNNRFSVTDLEYFSSCLRAYVI